LGNMYLNKWLAGKDVSSYFKKMFHAEFNTVLKMAPKGSSDADIARRFLKVSTVEGG
jgi:hypothetical protein